MGKQKGKSKKQPRPSGVTMTTNRRGQITFRSYGPNAPDLRTVFERQPADDECATCLGVEHIRDGETNELRRCLDCNGSGGMLVKSARDPRA